MATLRDNGSRVKRFRELKATLRTHRERLLVGIDIAQAAHVVHLRHAHTRVVVPALTIPNTMRGFAQLWATIQRAQRMTGCREVVCGLEPTGTYHQALATFLEAQGADVLLLLSSSVASWNRRTHDGTWDKNVSVWLFSPFRSLSPLLLLFGFPYDTSPARQTLSLRLSRYGT